jgi:outer membrane protein TolC
MKTTTLFLLCLLAALPTSAQLTLDGCRNAARANYPLIRKYALIEQAKSRDLSNANKAWLPQLQLNARAAYQSEVTQIPIDFSQLAAAGIHIPNIPIPAKDQYQASLDAAQTLWDGGAIRAQKTLIRAGSEVERAQLDVEMYALDEQVDRLFFGILLLDGQLEQTRLLIDELDRNLATVNSYIANGLAQPSDRDIVRVERLNAEQTRTQLLASRQSFIEMLGLMMGEPLSPDTQCLRPVVEDYFASRNALINRPELHFFEAQNALLDSRKALLQSASLPKLGLFLQGGYGRPGLNMLSTDFDPFYIGGLRLSWNFGASYTRKNDLHKIEINKNSMDAQRDLFLYSTRLALARENQSIARLRRLLLDDDEIIALRQSIRQSAEAKVANGTATVTDLMRELTRENLARQTKTLHEIDLLSAIYSLKNITNN